MDPIFLNDPAWWASQRPYISAGGAGGRAPGELDCDEIPELAGCVLFQSSGSTGAPKWIALTREALLLSAAAVNRHLRVDADSRWGLALPAYHVGGFGVHARSFEAACGLAVWKAPGGWNAREFARWVDEQGVSHSSLVPTQVYDLVAAGLRAPASLRAVVVGGGALADECGRRARELGWPVLASYGMTETGSQVATAHLSSLTTEFSGAPLPVLPIWRCGTERDGRLWVAGAGLFSGIVREDGRRWKFEARREIPVPGGTAWCSEDLVEVVNHETGGNEIRPLGRADRRVKVLGELVDLQALEDNLGRFGSYGGFANGDFPTVLALPDERRGGRLAVVFEGRIPSETALRWIREFNAASSGLVRLQEIHQLQRFPRSPLGKIKRRELESLLGPSTRISDGGGFKGLA